MGSEAQEVAVEAAPAVVADAALLSLQKRIEALEAGQAELPASRAPQCVNLVVLAALSRRSMWHRLKKETSNEPWWKLLIGGLCGDYM